MGITVKPSAYAIVPADKLRFALRWVCAEFGVSEKDLSKVIITGAKSKKNCLATYSPRSKTIRMYENLLGKDTLGNAGVLVHELVHAIQNAKAMYGIKEVDQRFSAVRVRYAGAQSKYFSDPCEIEAFAMQYKFLSLFGETKQMQYHIDAYSKRGVDLSKFL